MVVQLNDPVHFCGHHSFHREHTYHVIRDGEYVYYICKGWSVGRTL